MLNDLYTEFDSLLAAFPDIYKVPPPSPPSLTHMAPLSLTLSLLAAYTYKVFPSPV